MSFVPLKTEHVETLKASKEKVGYLQPIVVDADTGEILVGRHREKADPLWPRIQIAVKDAKQRVLIKLCGNIQRIVSQEETQFLLTRLAHLLEEEGVQKDHICSEISKIVPYTPEYVQRLLPKEYLMLSKARFQHENLTNQFAKTVRSVEQQELVSKLTSVAKNLVETEPQSLPFPNCRCQECDHKGDCY